MSDNEHARLAAEYGDVGNPARLAAPSRGVAAILGLLVPGLGHVYAGDLRRGLLWWSAVLAWAFAAAWLGLWDRFAGLVAAVLVALLLVIVSALDAARLAARSRGTERTPYQRWWIYLAYALLAILITPLFRAMLPLQSFAMQSEGMVPALVPGDHVMARKRHGGSGGIGGLERGAVLVFWLEEERSFFVQRLIGLPGETIRLVHGAVRIDGAPIDDPWGRGADADTMMLPPPVRAQLDDLGPFRIPEGAVFLLGDNRHRSYDSRMRGPIPVEAIRARPLYVYWNGADPSRIGRRVE